MRISFVICALALAAISGVALAQPHTPLQRPPVTNAPALRDAPSLVTEIRCPSARMSFSIDADVSSGWHAPSPTGQLSNTEVRVMGNGHPDKLVCYYNGFLQVDHDAPVGRHCAAVTGGFSCSLMRPAEAPPPQRCPVGTINVGGVCVPTN